MGTLALRICAPPLRQLADQQKGKIDQRSPVNRHFGSCRIAIIYCQLLGRVPGILPGIGFEQVKPGGQGGANCFGRPDLATSGLLKHSGALLRSVTFARRRESIVATDRGNLAWQTLVLTAWPPPSGA